MGLGATKLPTWVWGYLPPRAALALRTAARSYTESRLLPVIAVGGIAGSPLLSRSSHRSGKPPGLGGLSTPGLGAGGGSAESLDSPTWMRGGFGVGSPGRQAASLQPALSGLGRAQSLQTQGSLHPQTEPSRFVHVPTVGVAVNPPPPLVRQ